MVSHGFFDAKLTAILITKGLHVMDIRLLVTGTANYLPECYKPGVTGS